MIISNQSVERSKARANLSKAGCSSNRTSWIEVTHKFGQLDDLGQMPGMAISAKSVESRMTDIPNR